MHNDKHPLAGQTVDSPLGEYVVEDWWDHLTGGSWMTAEGNPAALKYAMRNATASLPIDDEVLYGHVDGIGHLVHVSEIVLQTRVAS